MTYFSIVMTSVLFVLWAVVCWRMILPLRVSRLTKFLLVVGGLVSLTLYYVTRLFVREGLPVELHATLRWIGYLSLGGISLTIPFLFAKELLQLGGRVVMFKKKSFDGARRTFLHNAGNAAVLAAVFPTMAFSVQEAFQEPVVKKNTLQVAGLPSDLEGVTIAQISDLHVGSILDGTWLSQLMRQVEDLRPDMLVLTGDAIDGRVSRVGKELDALSGFEAPLGKFFVTGNHEFYSGVEGWVEQMRSMNFTVLNNEHALVQNDSGKILVAGVWDYHGERFGKRYASSPFAAKADAPEHDVSILLAHQPKNIFEASKAGFDIQLSGHTHGGQYFPWTYAVHLFQPYVKGVHQVDGTTLYVSTGTGFWGPPMRLTVPPEITLHTLMAA
ncbi:metallophosphoesterase [Halodesulfovibrio marinisediminis]|nr:metallophosphoesterase [Halodesulfovibrio marinisediminis]